MSCHRPNEISEMLKGIERYNPENLQKLELYVEQQALKNEYDLEANLAILKLYQFNPNCFQPQVVVNILLKALTNLPHTDFILCKCLIDLQLSDECDSIRQVMALHTQLENCQFKDFWEVISRNQQFWQHITGFENSIRNYVCHVVNITFQKTEKTNLLEILGLKHERELSEWMKKNKWRETTPASSSVLVANQEEIIKTKNITEKIDFESVAPILAAYR